MQTPSLTDPLAGPPPARAELVGQRWTFQQVAAALGCTERSVYALVAELQIPFVRVLNKRFVDPGDIRAAIERRRLNTPPSRRGRPRKGAA